MSDWKLAKTSKDLPKKYREGKPFLAVGSWGFPLIMSVVDKDTEGIRNGELPEKYLQILAGNLFPATCGINYKIVTKEIK